MDDSETSWEVLVKELLGLRGDEAFQIELGLLLQGLAGPNPPVPEWAGHS